PWVAHWTEITDHRTRAVSELMHVEFSENDCARSFESTDNVSVLCWDAIFEPTAGSSRTHSSRIDEILQRDRDSMKWTTPTSALNLGFSFACSRQCGICRNGNKCV